jgi:glycosyltransferase involved in cell wall biosynthesis
MKFATTYPYYRQRHVFTAADQMGSTVVHTELLRSSLLHGTVESTYLIRDSPNSGELRAFAELSEEFGPSRVKLVSTVDYPAAASPSDTILVLKAPASIPFSQARQALGTSIGPICSLVHAVNWPNLMMSHFGLFCTQDSYDSLVVPSLAAKGAVLSIADQALEIIRNRFHAEGPPTRFRVEHIPFGIDPEPFTGVARGDARALLHLPHDEVVLLYFGRLSLEYKADLEPLIRLLARLVPEYPKLRLVLAGHDPQSRYQPVLNGLIEELGLRNHVTLMTEVSPVVKPIVLAAADVFVSPVDNIQESYGISLLEAMAAGLPVVASDWSGYREIVQQGSTGFLVRTYWSPSADRLANWVGPLGNLSQVESILAQRTAVDVGDLAGALRRLIGDEELRRAQGAAGRNRIQAEFSWETASRRFGELWRSQLEEYNSRGAKAAFEKHVRYGQVFARYATMPLDASAVLQRTAYGDQLLGGIGRDLPPGTRRSWPRIQELLAACNNPVSVGELLDPSQDDDFDQVCWLIKKDALNVMAAGDTSLATP